MYRSLNPSTDEAKKELKEHLILRHVPPDAARTLPRSGAGREDSDEDDDLDKIVASRWHEVTSLKQNITFRYPNQLGKVLFRRFSSDVFL